eukprot:TRINITY_DN2446_c0_g2_i6.p5 TRINITY_DN2446_c0_g2~~TRINITY_DN2446_c0_g2_i6.p5  ORF type:complete len:176 (-),score=6.17 TRINITY_DN2446_c0_g2_i6:891-1418(-)
MGKFQKDKTNCTKLKKSYPRSIQNFSQLKAPPFPSNKIFLFSNCFSLYSKEKLLFQMFQLKKLNGLIIQANNNYFFHQCFQSPIFIIIIIIIIINIKKFLRQFQQNLSPIDNNNNNTCMGAGPQIEKQQKNPREIKIYVCIIRKYVARTEHQKVFSKNQQKKAYTNYLSQSAFVD